jgi:hypothetical protein
MVFLFCLFYVDSATRSFASLPHDCIRMSQSSMPVRNARDPPRSMPYPPSGTRFERPQSPGTYDQNSTDQSYDNMPESPFFGNSANIYDSGTSALVHTPIHEMPQLNFSNSLNVRNANVLRPQQNQAAYLVTKITSRAKLDDERRRVAQDFNLVSDQVRIVDTFRADNCHLHQFTVR